MAPEVSDGPGSAMIFTHASGLLIDGEGWTKTEQFQSKNTQKFPEIHQTKRNLNFTKWCETLITQTKNGLLGAHNFSHRQAAPSPNIQEVIQADQIATFWRIHVAPRDPGFWSPE